MRLPKLSGSVAGMIAFVVVTLGLGTLGFWLLADPAIAAHTAEWRGPVTCRLENPSQPYEKTIDNIGSKLDVRAVDVVCPSAPEPVVIHHNVEMPIGLSAGTTHIWQNNRTHQIWIENSLPHYNGDNNDPPPTGSGWEITSGFGSPILGIIAGSVVGTRISRKREAEAEAMATAARRAAHAPDLADSNMTTSDRTSV